MRRIPTKKNRDILDINPIETNKTGVRNRECMRWGITVLIQITLTLQEKLLLI